ncbi:hypothetical protein R3P38DRAFT_3176563 [Favolaschia claudopus]|uniref:Uncharacterized protein n=1 Tax=Favolaschia claudopus TaxID=2862362 RepID=A0AAW0CZG2_9AGAR
MDTVLSNGAFSVTFRLQKGVRMLTSSSELSLSFLSFCMPSGFSRDVLQYIDDAASDGDSGGSELSLSVHESDILFINDDTDLSVHSPSEPFAVMDDESELSALSHEETDVVNGGQSDSDVVIVPTPTKRGKKARSPTKRGKKARRSRQPVQDANTEEEDAAITPGDRFVAQFQRREYVC